MNLATLSSVRRAKALAGLATVAAAALLATPARAQEPQAPTSSAMPASTVIAIVKVPTPRYAPRAVVLGKMRDAVAQYAQLPGLSHKAFSFAREGGDYGGIYYWRDLASAKAWFSPAWFERVRSERGVDGRVLYLEALISIDNTPGGTPPSSDSSAVATVVEIPIPAGVTRERLFAEFKAAVPTYQQVPGLLRKHFTVSDAGSFGGVYLWKDEASAKAWFNPAWQDRVRVTYGSAAKIEWYDTPILMPSQRPENLALAAALIVAKP